MKSLIVIVLITVPLLLTGCAETPTEIQASELCCEYWTYESEADAQFKGRSLIATGMVGRLDINNLRIPYAILVCHCNLPTIQESLGYGVECQFDESYIDDWLTLREGQYAQIRGKCNGCAKSLFGKGEPGNIILLNCQVAK